MSNIGNKEILSRNLKQYMNKKGITQKEMSEIVGVATSTFNDWMKAKKYPRIDKIEIMANYFGILKSDLIEEKMTEEKSKKNDTMAGIVTRLRIDDEFLDVVEKIEGLSGEDLEKVKKMLTALF